MMPDRTDHQSVDHGLYCSLSESAWTDPFSNQTQLSGSDNDRDLYLLLEQRKLPFSCLGTFLHESVHNWCFDTRLGIALASCPHLVLRYGDSLRIFRISAAIVRHCAMEGSNLLRLFLVMIRIEDNL
jgi:hypothetical protein